MLKTHFKVPVEVRRLGLTISIVFIAACSSEEQQVVTREDYMSSELRARVEQLKSDLATEATNESTIVERADLLADWIDAYALSGGEVGIDAPRVRLQATLPPTGRQAENQSRSVDRFIREFVLRDEEGSLGLLTSDTLGPFEVSSMAELRQTWRVGTHPITSGGGFWVARHFNANWGQFQTDDPTAAGYVSITTDDDDAVFERETFMARGPHGGFRTPQPAIAFRLIEGELDRGSSVTITYGDRSQGGPGIQTPTFESERMPLPLYVDLDGSSEWRSLPITPFEIIGGETNGVHGFAPSVVEPGEMFELSVRAQDRYFNRATGDIPAFEVLINDTVVATTPAGSDAITLLDLSLNETGAHWISIRSEDGSISGEGNPILVEENPELRIYWGDTHGHSGYSEGIGTVDYFMRFARDDARLDYVTHSEHDVSLDAGEWDLIRRTSAEYDEPGKFIPFLGWEWTRHTRFGGHHNVLFRNIEDQTPVSALEFPVLSSLYAELHERHDPNNIVVIPHAHNPGDFRQSDPQLEPIIEIMSMHGSFQWFMEAYLSHGHEVGVVAASDDHLSRPGYSAPHRDSLAQRGGLGAVLAPERSRDAIFDGMKAKRTYATTGDRIILDFDVNGTGMGQRADYSESRSINGRAIGTAPIKSIQLLKNDEIVWEQEYLTSEEMGGEQQILVSFSSDPTPFYRGDAPRGWRHWRGQLSVSGATVAAAESMDFFNPTTQAMLVNSNTINFRTITRGDTSSILLTLEDVSDNSTLSFDFEEATETGSAPPFYRQHSTIGATQAEISLNELIDGKISLALPTQDFPDDAITLRRVISAGEKDISFAFEDPGFPDQGDYYYFKVEQANDAIAWSSPIWVGGFSSQ
ncbi:MAG: DUF3604 domain-containing protein [Pseudomonadales bacterium]|nr:DUF3604 domain-containing protein [Pseudomonadales bacterium]